MNWIQKHPLLAVLIVATALRIPAVLYSKGFAYNDDHYETVTVASNWLQHGLMGTTGHLTWSPGDDRPPERFPLYTLALFGVMKILRACGAQTLDQMMYGVRAAHALLSLLSVWGAFALVEIATGSKRWGMIAGLLAGAHLAMPFFAVRNLIEMVGGHVWLIAMVCVYLYYQDRRIRWLVVAGILSGLAAMFRLQILAACVAIPIALLLTEKRVKPAVGYLVGLTLMILLAGIADMVLLGRFLGSSISPVTQGFSHGAMYKTHVLIYPAVLVAFFVPPFSLIGLGLMGVPSFWKKHLPLCLSSVSFILIHTLIANRQERFVMPLVPILCAGIILALHHHWGTNGFFARRKGWFWGLTVPSIAINFALLPIFTLNYGHKGVVESLVQVGKSSASPHVLFASPGIDRWYPLHYTGFEPFAREQVANWSDFAKLRSQSAEYLATTNFFLLFPADSTELIAVVDSVRAVYGPVKEYSHIEPSLVDWTLHALNPTHNRTQEAWIYVRDNSAAASQHH